MKLETRKKYHDFELLLGLYHMIVIVQISLGKWELGREGYSTTYI